MESDVGLFGKQLMPDELLSYFQQTGQAVCSYCGSDITVIDTQDIDHTGSNFVGDRLKCEECRFPREQTSHSDTAAADNNAGSKNGVLRDSQDEVLGVTPSVNESVCTPAIPPRIDYTSKLEVLLTDIQDHYTHDKRYSSAPICKEVTNLASVVFSAWKQSLNAVGRLFHEHGIDFCRVDGDLRLQDRKKVLEKFRDDPATRVLLMTLGTGSVGYVFNP
jgi:SNF2 family DNA or RNA helicase